MESFNQNVIRHKTGLLNLAAELGNISKACRMMGVSRDTFYRYQAAREAGGIEALFDVNRRKPNLKNRVGAGKTSLIKQLAARLNYPVFEITGHGRLEFAGLVGHLTVQNGNMTYAYGPLAWRAMGLFPCWAASWKARGTAAMTAALLGDGGEAEAAPMKLPPEVQRLVHQLGKRKPSGVDLGPLQDDIFAALQNRNDAYKLPELFASANDIRHLQKSRMEKPRANQKMTPEEIGAMVNSLQNSTRARVVTGKDAYPDAVIVPHGERSYFGVLRPDDGRVGLQTAYYPKTRTLPNRLGSAQNSQTTFRDWVDANLPSNYAPRSMGGREFTQRELSAVEPLQVAVEETLPEVASSVNKKIIPAALLAAALGGDAAQAVESNEPSASSGGNLRALGIGARDVLEGLGEGVGFVANPFANLLNAAAGGSPTYFSEANAGRALADLLGLPAAESDAENFLSGISRGAASVLPTMGAGVALNAAKAAPLLANDLLASPRMQAAFGAGVGGFDEALRLLMGE